jgi:hypothetical protein
MIQRIQTIFLILTVGVFGALFKLPLATSDKPSTQFLSDQVYNILDHPALLGLCSIGALLALISIFMFKNRKLQLKFGYVILLIAISIPITAILLFKNISPSIDSSVHVIHQAGMFIPIAAVLFVIFSNYFIRKDDKLVKSMDRLR